MSDWSPSGWRTRPAAQLPVYPDAGALARVEAKIAAAPPLVAVADIRRLQRELADVAAGRAFLLQGGDCAESFAEYGIDKVRTTHALLTAMGQMLHARSGAKIVHLARIAGQFAKPRSAETETRGPETLASYRGDAVNGPGFDAVARVPDPDRLLAAHCQAQATVELLDSLAAASPETPPVFTSHEALLLNYEQALTRLDTDTGLHWATSGHMVWIGDRTRDPDGAHVDYARGIANPIGLKCGPTLDADTLLRLIDILDPGNVAGRLVLIGRFGAGEVADHLPALMRATRRAGRRAIWSIDPMHGNTREVGGRKTRLLGDIGAEIESFFAIARSEGVYPGGVHLEMTGADVTECLGGSLALSEADLPRNYLTHCDPRLNRGQALDIAGVVADRLVGAATRTEAA